MAREEQKRNQAVYLDVTPRLDKELASSRKLPGVVTPEFLKTMSETQQWFDRQEGKIDKEVYRYYLHEKTDTLQSEESKMMNKIVTVEDLAELTQHDLTRREQKTTQPDVKLLEVANADETTIYLTSNADTP